MRTTIDAAGRVVVPKPLRDALHFTPGQLLEVRAQDGQLVIEAAPVEMRLVRRRRGVVAVPTEPLPTLSAEHVRETLDATRR
jgi:AbrB family looped-hinge helix DNA binding protein